MKSANRISNRTKFSQKLRKTLVSMAEDSLKSGEKKLISIDVLDNMRNSV